jgi:hypothetical protein
MPWQSRGMTTATLTRTHTPPRFPDGVIRRRDLLAAGVSQHTVATRCRPGGPWQLVLPGVLMLANSPPTRRQRLRAALLYAGEHAVITGVQALHEHGLTVANTEEVHVLVPTQKRKTTRGFVRVERTSRLPQAVVFDGLPHAPSARAAVDAARTTDNPTKQRTLLLAPVHAGIRTIDQIRTELNAGSQRGTAALRALLNEPPKPTLTSTLHEGWARRVTRRTPIPPPIWHVRLYDKADQLLGIADAWWDEVALAWDFGHQRDARSATRHGVFAKEGVATVRTALPDLRSNPAKVAEQLAAAFLQATRRPRPPVRAVP